MVGAPAEDGFAIDIVNEGSGRWKGDGDGFHVMGVITEPGATSFSFGWMDSQRQPAVPLDPGEYARVNVMINPGYWEKLQPGRYDLHAVLVDLGLRSAEPLSIELSAELIARHQPRRPRESDLHRSREEQLRRVQTWVAASGALDRLAAVVTAAETDAAAIAGIAELLDVEPQDAEGVYHAPLQNLRPANAAAALEHAQRAAGAEH